MRSLRLALVALAFFTGCVDATAPVTPVSVVCTVHQLPDGTTYDVCRQL